jgi:hypothetical protein
MTPEYIMRASLCRPPFCATDSRQRREYAIAGATYAQDYGEPGYDQPDKGIIFADWNYFPRDIGDILGRAGWSIEWSDQWTTCSGCGKALRSQADRYDWQPSYITTSDCDYHCLECLTTDDIEALEDNPRTAVNLSSIDLKEHGYREIQCGYESGWHTGMSDDPVKIYNELVEHGHERLLFVIDESSQFYITFCVWEKLRIDT